MQEILSGLIPPPYESLDFFYEILGRLEEPAKVASNPSLPSEEDKGKAKEKGKAKIDRSGTPSSSLSLQSAHPKAEIDRLLNEPFDERRREEIIEKIRSLPLSVPSPSRSHVLLIVKSLP